MALMIFGIVLNRNGWSIDYFGINTPVEELERAVDATHPDLVVLAATVPETLESLRPKLAALARRPRSPWPAPAQRPARERRRGPAHGG